MDFVLHLFHPYKRKDGRNTAQGEEKNIFFINAVFPAPHHYYIWTMNMEERILAERCKAGDNEARRELYTRYGGRLLSICLRYAGDRAVAEDLLHDAFLKIFGAFDRFAWRGEGSLRAWMARITVNVALEALRRKHRLHYPVTVEHLPEQYEEPTSAEMARVPYEVLRQMIAELPDGYRTIFNLFCIEELPHREIAERLGISEKTSSSQLFRAKALLARRIREYLKKDE